eukprot:2144984-Rhodomonas_salina.2
MSTAPHVPCLALRRALRFSPTAGAPDSMAITAQSQASHTKHVRRSTWGCCGGGWSSSHEPAAHT